MKKTSEVKYPNSANLFRFCRRVLDHRYGNIRVIDQDVGQILGFDPADCSHWKKGKKNIRSIQAIKSIADQLQVDEKLVVDIVVGEIDESEAFNEFNGYSPFALNPKLIEEAKKEYYRIHMSSWSKEKETAFKEHFQIDSNRIDKIVASIHEKIDFAEPPLYLPEIVSNYPAVSLRTIDETSAVPRTLASETSSDQICIYYKNGTEVKPFVRYKIAKNLAQYFLSYRDPIDGMDVHQEHIDDIESTLFAAKLLTPLYLIRQELKRIDPGRDLVSQLAETFWVSKGLINRRLADLLTNSSGT